MTPGLLWLLIVWGALTVVLVILLIYRSTLTMQEDDQLFLDDSASAMAKDQMELMAKVNKITPVVKYAGCGFGSDDPGDRRLGGLPGIERGPALSASLGMAACGRIWTRLNFVEAHDWKCTPGKGTTSVVPPSAEDASALAAGVRCFSAAKDGAGNRI